VKRGHVHGSTDDYAWNITADPVHVHDMQATIMHLMGIDHTRLTFRYQDRQFRISFTCMVTSRCRFWDESRPGGP
jgi:hypothetical protein